jgi:hypothetical protein
MSKEPFRGTITADSYAEDPQHRRIADQILNQVGEPGSMVNRVIVDDELITVEYFPPSEVGKEPKMRRIEVKRAAR